MLAYNGSPELLLLKEASGHYQPNSPKLLDQVRTVMRRQHYDFPSYRLSVDPRSGKIRRHHLHESGLRKAVKQAAKQLSIFKPVGLHTLRHCFTTHLLENGYDIRTVQELLGHKRAETTMIYTRMPSIRHVIKRGGLAVRSPIDTL